MIEYFFLVLFKGFVIFLNMISQLASITCKIAIERDWMPIIARKSYEMKRKGSSSATFGPKDELKSLKDESKEAQKKKKREEFKKELARINSSVRRFDLSTGSLSPLFAGLIMSFFKFNTIFTGAVSSAIVFAVWNLVSLVFEFLLLRSVYESVPELHKPKLLRDKRRQPLRKFARKTRAAWAAFCSQGLLILPSIVLAVLYLTVFSFDSITIGYAKAQKLNETAISLFQILGSVMSILGTIAFPIMHRSLLYLSMFLNINNKAKFLYIL